MSLIEFEKDSDGGSSTVAVKGQQQRLRSGRAGKNLNAAVKGLEVRPIHLDNAKANRTVIIDGICKESAKTA
ncbi:hypothetical protein L3Y34_002440 [Caenorhabditis briggsae]|uniref:Uncharacterized protein n=1 Tax=Caenorhabditis briggsae TaxID=6238 RepID=A0AAE9DFS4_CAEBR|nr:hypothetical protein L3Y34_002440 [Caenorhabditis briggsae]